MSLQRLKTHVKTIIDTPRVDFKWSSEHNEDLLCYLSENFESSSLLNKEVQQEIKKSIREHFESIGYTMFKITEDKLFVKLIPYKTEPKDSVNLDAIIDIIDKNEEYIQYNYNDKDDLICLQKELTLQLTHFVNKINNEEINKKELLKYAVKEAFELQKSDIVIIKNNQTFIKLFSDCNIRKISEKEKNTIANRYNGIAEKELKSFYNDFFIKDENKNFFYSVAEQFVDLYMLEKKIDNFTYEKYAFSLIQSIVTENLTNTFGQNDDFFKGFSGYIFRIHFKEVFIHITNLILSELSISNKYIIEFLKYYSLNIVVLDGQKYKVPEIEASNKMKWNVASMMSIVKIYVKTEISLDATIEQRLELEEKISELLVGSFSPVEYNAKIAKEVEKIEQTLIYATKRLNIYVDSLDSSKNSEEAGSLKNDIREIQQEIQIKKDEKVKLLSKMATKAQLLKYNNKKREIDALKRQERRDEKILAQNKTAYLSIRNSLLKALTSKKILLEDA
ncbi:hypothetical protein [Sulfurimonas sp.]|jgi:hypothetical protein|uniref:hypothetical protein n=1 Tax=Sulfurimonas sp. TaxID=2022749 RepID=UPI0025D60EED|nr:hypothetical protein [Sulfurimonas sp.]MCK9472368.1 hypothetical protein [Sulfurimonas sp.]MDD3505146.1 hypothetical protein [Sulfurimonas sp.]